MQRHATVKCMVWLLSNAQHMHLDRHISAGQSIDDIWHQSLRCNLALTALMPTHGNKSHLATYKC